MTVTLTPATWALLRLEILGGQSQHFVNGVQVINYTDAAPLAEGMAGFAASSDAALRVDDFAIYGLPVAVIAPTPDAKTGNTVQTLGAIDAPTNLVATVNG